MHGALELVALVVGRKLGEHLYEHPDDLVMAPGPWNGQRTQTDRMRVGQGSEMRGQDSENRGQVSYMRGKDSQKREQDS